MKFKQFLLERYSGSAILTIMNDSKLKKIISETQNKILDDVLVINKNAVDTAPDGREMNHHVSVLANISQKINKETVNDIHNYVGEL